MILSPAVVKKKKFWTPAGKEKLTFSLFLERISKKNESFECFSPGVGYYLWQNTTVDQIKFSIQYTAKINYFFSVTSRPLTSYYPCF